jgi:hypothetical protein
VAVVSNGDAIDDVMLVAFGNGADAMKRTGAFIADTGHSDAPNREVRRSDVHDLATVARWVVQTDDVTHDVAEYGSDVDNLAGTS